MKKGNWKQVSGGSSPGLTGSVPKVCDICHRPFELHLPAFDAKTVDGPWGWLCPSCFSDHGIGLGIGLGQEYHWQPDTADNKETEK